MPCTDEKKADVKRCRWRDDRQILSGGRTEVTATDEDLRHRLVISVVQQSDAGQYVVKLTDRTDQSLAQSSSAKLIVIPRQLTTAGMYALYARAVLPLIYLSFPLSSPVSIQTQSLALRALRKRKPQETQALALAISQSWLPLLRPSIPIGWHFSGKTTSPEVAHYVSSATLNSTHSLTHSFLLLTLIR